MAHRNIKMKIGFTKRLNSFWLQNVENYVLGSSMTIVVNVGNQPVVINTPAPKKTIAPMHSTIHKDVTISSGDSIVCIEIPGNFDNVGGVLVEDGWQQLSKLVKSFSADVPLFKSPQFVLGRVRFDPFAVCGQTQQPEESKIADYQVKVNLWFCPEKSNCGIHNGHSEPEILEVHTQIYGTGRMQKFKENNFGTIYEDVIMSPGTMHAPFAGVKEDGDLFYGWHQYYSDTDCIWMANEFHPIKN